MLLLSPLWERRKPRSFPHITPRSFPLPFAAGIPQFLQMDAPTRFHSRNLRNGRVSLPNHIYLITFTTKNRAELFNDFRLACAASRALSEPGLWRDARLMTWVLMPDHWHGLLQLGDVESLSTVVGRAKAISARVVNTLRGTSSTVWQPGFHDRALRTDEAVLDVARYVIANPVRAGLSGRIDDYSFWDSEWAGPGFSLA